MSDQTNDAPDTEKPDAQSADEPDQAIDEQHQEARTGDDADDDAKLRSEEAARYRRKLRDTEAERDQLAARLSDVQRAEVERQITGEGGLQEARDFWTAGVELDQLLDDQGGIDAEKVKAARDRVIEQHPHWAHQPSIDFDGGARQPAFKRTPSFGEAVKRAGTG